MRIHRQAFMVTVMLLYGCASSVSHAPIDSRDSANKPAAVTATSDSGVQAAAASPAWTPPKTSASKAAASPPATAKPAGSAAATKYHVVKRGETLYSIAWHYGVNYRDLAAANNIRSPYTIYKGQRLRVAASAVQAAAGAAPPKSATAKAPASKPAARRAPPAKPAQAATRTRTSSAAKAGGAAYDGKWVWPTRGRVLTGFHSSGAGKKGIDIGGHADQPVKAAASGRVVYAGSGLVGYGRLIIVKHNENLLSAYGHNNKLLVQEGEHVSAGQMIAKMGDSGTNRNELYFEIRKNGKPTDPLKYLPRQ